MNLEKKNLGFSFKIIIPIMIILIGVGGFWYFYTRQTKIRRKPTAPRIPTVQTITATYGNRSVNINVMGTVTADRKITLSARASGQVIKVSPEFTRGSIVKKDQLLLCIDDSDYKIEKQKAEIKLAEAQAELEIEKGRQQIARKELDMVKSRSNSGLANTELALRKPHMQKALARLESARADLKKAKLNLSRTFVRAPFTALILKKNIDLGGLVSMQSPLAELVDVNSYQVEAQVPFGQISKIIINPENGSQAVISSFSGEHVWQGKVTGSTGKVSDQTKMAGLLISIANPLGVKNPSSDSLLLGDYVRILIKGRTLENVFALPREVVRENNTIWLLKDNSLKIVSVKPLWKEKDQILIKDGLCAGDKIIKSNLFAPLPGMALKLKK